MKDYTTDEKVDFIFNELKSQKRNRHIKTFIKLIIFSVIIYVYYNFISGLDFNNLRSSFTQIIIDIVKPIIKNLTSELMNDPQLLNNIK